jgi:hypothetical protein
MVDTFDVSNIVKRSWAFNGLMSSAALLLPIAAVPESRVESEGPGTAVQAAAHVNFKIVIPRVLYLHIGVGDGTNPERVAIMSNSRNVWLTATVRTRDDHSHAARGNVVLSAAGRNIIAQNTPCGAVDPLPAVVAASRVICTVSMP